MTIEGIKEELKHHIGDNITINYSLGRNKHEIYHVCIKELYNHIFLVKTKDNIIKSFSYSDVISKTIRINYKV